MTDVDARDAARKFFQERGRGPRPVDDTGIADSSPLYDFLGRNWDRDCAVFADGWVAALRSLEAPLAVPVGDVDAETSIRKDLAFHRGLAAECRAHGVGEFGEGRATGIEDLANDIEGRLAAAALRVSAVPAVPVTPLGDLVTTWRKLSDGFRAQGDPPANTAADYIAQCANELEAALAVPVGDVDGQEQYVAFLRERGWDRDYFAEFRGVNIREAFMAGRAALRVSRPQPPQTMDAPQQTTDELIAEIDRYVEMHCAPDPKTGCTDSYERSLFGSIKKHLRFKAGAPVVASPPSGKQLNLDRGSERSVVTPPDAVRAAIESLQRWDTIPYHEGIGRYAYGAFVRYEDVLAALASRGDVAGYSEVLAMANDAVEKRGIKDVAALHYIDGYLAAAGEFSGKPGLYEGSYPPGSGETSVQAVRETTWPIYDTPCIPSCRAAGPVTHTRGCHNNGKISPVEAASGNYDREPSSLSSGTVSE